MKTMGVLAQLWSSSFGALAAATEAVVVALKVRQENNEYEYLIEECLLGFSTQR